MNTSKKHIRGSLGYSLYDQNDLYTPKVLGSNFYIFVSKNFDQLIKYSRNENFVAPQVAPQKIDRIVVVLYCAL